MTTLEGHAPAKLNLTLEVLGRRADGFHEIASVMHTLRLGDALTLELPPPERLDPARGAIRCEEMPEGVPLCEGVPTDSSNLVWCAVAQFVGALRGRGVSQSASPLAWRATLLKRIPSQAGLGGGSSDAACALRLLNQWAAQHGCALPDDTLHAIASALGADVAFFLRGGCARAQGKGERLQPLPTLPAFWWVLAKPDGVGVPTSWAYAQLGRSAYTPTTPAPHTDHLIRQLPSITTPYQLAPLLHNDFDTPILEAIPLLTQVRTVMEEGGALRVILCGSGAAQAALCESADHARTLAHTLCLQGWWAVAVQNG
ncbi:MAG: 4-(cytidine 5'-diphospho)-2-C-methyl-D-erythritol kinase [Fimbriimonadales bacterium]